MRRASVIRRVLAKEVLRQALAELSLLGGNGADSIHGEFGSAESWLAPTATGASASERVLGWLERQADEVERVTGVLLQHADDSLRAQREALVGYCLRDLVPKIDRISTDPRYPQEALSERLANAGVLPMFGFPTRIRYLFHERPKSAWPWPPDDVVDRELDIAISQFAPGAETVKDGLIHTAVGVVDFRPGYGEATEMPDPLGPSLQVGCCSECQAVDGAQPPPATCAVCGATQQQDPGYRIVAVSQPAGFRTWYGHSRISMVSSSGCRGRPDRRWVRFPFP